MNQAPGSTLQVKDICSRLLALEQKYDLLDWEVEGVKLWQAQRMQLYWKIARKTGVLEKRAKKKKSNSGLSDKISKTKLLFNSLCSPAFMGRSRLDVMVFPSNRIQRQDNRAMEPYVDPWIRQYADEQLKYLVVEVADAEILHLSFYRPYAHLYVRNWLLENNKRRKRFEPQWSLETQEFLNQLAQELNETFSFSVPLNLNRMFKSGYVRFMANYRVYTAMLKRRKPQKILLVCGYGRAALIKAAKDLGIEVIELQHGTFSPYHLGYSFPERKEPLDYFPDTLYCWGPFWSDITALPPCRIEYTGFPHFRKQRNAYQNLERNAGQIVVLSQPVIGHRLADLLWQHREVLAPYHIVYKLHPFEYHRVWENTSLVRLMKLPNFSLRKDTDLYRLLAESEFALGVFSTALYEAIGFGCKPVFADLPGLEYMAPLIDQYGVPVLKPGSSIEPLIRQAKTCEVPVDDLF